MLAKAVASQAGGAFFNVGASTVVSKYMGDSERLVRCLFGMARHYAPATIFFDEIDGLMSARGGGGEHEASRRLKTELLAQMDGVCSGDAAVLVLAATNKPWDLDEALRRRLEKRLFVGLPEREARAALLRLLLRDVALEGDVDVEVLAAATEGYSGADLKVVCREAAMAPLRRYGPQEMLRLRDTGALTPAMLAVSMADLQAALAKTPPSVGAAELPHYLEWKVRRGRHPHSVRPTVIQSTPCALAKCAVTLCGRPSSPQADAALATSRPRRRRHATTFSCLSLQAEGQRRQVVCPWPRLQWKAQEWGEHRRLGLRPAGRRSGWHRPRQP